MDRNRWHVTTHEKSWQVKREGTQRSTAVTSKQQEAIDRAVRIAKIINRHKSSSTIATA